MLASAAFFATIASPGLDADRLDATLDRTRRKVGAPAAAQVVLTDDGAWAGASGRVRGRDARPDEPYRIASITKTYVAAVLVSLHVEGVLSLDDPASRWVPDAPHGDRYTLRQVLGHQTGLRDYVKTPGFALSLGRPGAMGSLLDGVSHRPLAFEPGTDYAYSNTNYLVAGLAIEAATGRSWADEVHDRLLAPIGLEETWLPTRDGEPADLVPGRLGPFDVTGRFDPTRSGPGGEIVATASDVARFAQALFLGDLVDPEVVRLMTTEGRTADGRPTGHGLGVSITRAPSGTLLGHSGSTVSHQSRLHVDPARRAVVVSLVNSFFSEADVLDDGAWGVLAGLDRAR